MNFLKKQSVLLGVLGAVLLGWLFPEWGASGGYLRSEIVTKVGVVIIFFLQGLGLPYEKFREGVADIRLHFFSLGWNFLLAPLLGIAFAALGAFWLPQEVTWGLLYVSVLPTTIFSAVAFVAMAEGNVAGAIFSTALSNIAGVFITPLWVSVLIIAGSPVDFDLGSMLGKLFVLIVLPMVAGQALHGLAEPLLSKLKPITKPLNAWIINFMVFAAFANSMQSDAWGQFSVHTLLILVALTLAFLGIVSGLVWWSSGLVGMSRDSRIAAFFCGSQKTLAAGVPMATTLFAGLPIEESLGILLIPLLIYHPSQLILASIVLNKNDS